MDHAPKSVASQSLPSSAAAAAAAATSASSASASSVATIAAAVAASSQKHKENHKIRSDILDDLSSRFIINVPVAERSDFIRISFQIELAHWFYLDFYCSAEDTRLVPCGIKQFAFHIFHVSVAQLWVMVRSTNCESINGVVGIIWSVNYHS